MKKLRLQDLQVSTFEPAPAVPLSRGTVDGHAKPTQYFTCGGPTDPALDCTYHCSEITGCPNGCVALTELDC